MFEFLRFGGHVLDRPFELLVRLVNRKSKFREECRIARSRGKGSFGFHPIGVWCDNTTELLAAKLRPGNAGANTTADHIEVLAAAITQIPRSHRKHLLIGADGAGASHGLLDWLTEHNQVRGQRVEYSIGFALTEALRQAIMGVPAKVWTPALDADGAVRAGGDVAELTGLLSLPAWPAGMRVIVRRERPHPGAQLSIFEERDGYRYQAFVTNTATGQLAFLEARHRAHARVEDMPVMKTIQECLQSVLWNGTSALAPLNQSLPRGLVVVPVTDREPCRLVVAWNGTVASPLIGSFIEVAAALFNSRT